jgi:hypothetical protein
VRPQSCASGGWSRPAFAIAGVAVEVADAVQIGLGAAQIVQSQVAASSGSFTLTYDRAQRLLTTEARAQMPGAQQPKQTYRRLLFSIGTNVPGLATAMVTISWEGNVYGEIGTPVIERDLRNSTEWSHSSATINISSVQRIPDPGSDPRAWPLVYAYTGTYDVMGNGNFEFSGRFKVNAFGGLEFEDHTVISRALIELAIQGRPEEYVVAGPPVVMPTPPIPREQLDFLRTRLP